MGINRLLAPLALVLLAAAPAAAEYTKYADLRGDNPAIDETIALLSASDLHGTFNRISALHIRAAIRNLEDGSDPDLLPENFVRGLKAAMIDLETDLIDAGEDLEALSCSALEPVIDCLSVEDIRLRKWILVQVVNSTLGTRLTELNRAGEMLTCHCDDCAPGGTTFSCAPEEGASSDLNLAFQDLISGPTIGPWLIEVIDAAERSGLTSWCTSVGLCEIGTNANNFAARVNELRTGFSVPLSGNLHIHGEPVIE